MVLLTLSHALVREWLRLLGDLPWCTRLFPLCCLTLQHESEIKLRFISWIINWPVKATINPTFAKNQPAVPYFSFTDDDFFFLSFLVLLLEVPGLMSLVLSASFSWLMQMPLFPLSFCWKEVLPLHCHLVDWFKEDLMTPVGFIILGEINTVIISL